MNKVTFVLFNGLVIFAIAVGCGVFIPTIGDALEVGSFSREVAVVAGLALFCFVLGCALAHFLNAVQRQRVHNVIDTDDLD